MKNYTISQQKSKDQKTTLLVYSGELSFNHIHHIYNETATLIKVNPEAEVLIEDVDLLDLSFIQLLISLKKTYQTKISFNINEDLTDLIQVSGFNKYLIEEN